MAGVHEKYGKMIGGLIGDAILRGIQLQCYEGELQHKLLTLMRECGPGVKLLLSESIISSGKFLLVNHTPVVDRFLQVFTLFLNDDFGLLDGWWPGEHLESSINVFLQTNSDVVVGHLARLDEIVLELTEDVASSLDGSAFTFQSLLPFGSSVSKLCVAGNCDVDMVLFVANREVVEAADNPDGDDAANVLTIVHGHLLAGASFDVKDLVLRTRVPVLKLRHVTTGTEVK